MSGTRLSLQPGTYGKKKLYCRAVTTNCWLAPCHNRVILQGHSKTYQLCRRGKHFVTWFPAGYRIDSANEMALSWRKSWNQCLPDTCHTCSGSIVEYPKMDEYHSWFLSVIFWGYMIYPIYHVNLSLSLPIVACLLKYLPKVTSYLHPNVTSLYHNVTSHYIPICPIRGETKL